MILTRAIGFFLTCGSVLEFILQNPIDTIESWYHASSTEKAQMPVKYRADAFLGKEVQWKLITFDFYQKYMAYLAFLIERDNLDMGLYQRAMENFALRFLMKGKTRDALEVIWAMLDMVQNPFEEVFKYLYYTLYFDGNINDRIGFVYNFAKMFNACANVETIFAFLESVDIDTETRMMRQIRSTMEDPLWWDWIKYQEMMEHPEGRDVIACIEMVNWVEDLVA